MAVTELLRYFLRVSRETQRLKLSTLLILCQMPNQKISTNSKSRYQDRYDWNQHPFIFEKSERPARGGRWDSTFVHRAYYDPLNQSEQLSLTQNSRRLFTFYEVVSEA